MFVPSCIVIFQYTEFEYIMDECVWLNRTVLDGLATIKFVVANAIVYNKHDKSYAEYKRRRHRINHEIYKIKIIYILSVCNGVECLLQLDANVLYGFRS